VRRPQAQEHNWPTCIRRPHETIWSRLEGVESNSRGGRVVGLRGGRPSQLKSIKQGKTRSDAITIDAISKR